MNPNSCAHISLRLTQNLQNKENCQIGVAKTNLESKSQSQKKSSGS